MNTTIAAPAEPPVGTLVPETTTALRAALDALAPHLTDTED